MSVYRDAVSEIQQEKLIGEMYRVESDKSSQNMKIDETGILTYQNNNIYTYFSLSNKHHQYFLDKRLFSYLSDILVNNGLSINKSNILDSKKYGMIKNLIINDDNISLFLCMKLHTSSIIFGLLEENSCRIENKHIYFNRLPEKSDPKRHGGGYGVCGPWLDLILNFTFFSEIHSFNSGDALDFLEQARKNYSIYGIRRWFELPIYQIKLNQSILSPFHKYEIVNNLEQIVEMKLAKPNSSLMLDSVNTIKSIRKEYEQQKEKTLKTLEKNYKKYL